MKKLIFIILFSLFTVSAYSNTILDCEINNSLIMKNVNSGFVDIYKINKAQEKCFLNSDIEIGIWEPQNDEFLKNKYGRYYLVSNEEKWLIHFYRNDFYDDWGGSVEIIDDNLILIIEGDPFTTNRIFFNTSLEKLIYLPNSAKMTLTVDKKIIFEGIKTYFIEGGAIWFDAVYDFKGNIIEFINIKNSTNCHSVLKIWSEEYANELINNGLEEVCVR